MLEYSYPITNFTIDALFYFAGKIIVPYNVKISNLPSTGNLKSSGSGNNIMFDKKNDKKSNT